MGWKGRRWRGQDIAEVTVTRTRDEFEEHRTVQEISEMCGQDLVS